MTSYHLMHYESGIYIPEDGFYDITSSAFNGNEYNENIGMVKALVLNGISNILNNNLEINKSLKFNKRGNIDYNKSDIKVFINKPRSFFS